MNLSEALDAALPEIPKTRYARSAPPRLDPDLIVREDFLDGEPIFGVFQRGKANYFRFEPLQWRLALLFDGTSSYEEIAARYVAETGLPVTVLDVRTFAESMEESDFWYKSAQEKNLAMSDKLTAQRDRRTRRKSKINLAHITFSAWDPDRYLTWLDGITGRFFYNRWTVIFAVALFCFESVVFVAKWKVLGPDIRLYFNFTHKTFADIVEFWMLLLVLGFIHESAHGLTCKHYGGEVHSMGLLFLYLTPAFYVDVTETWISATKVQRLATIIAGIWVEMIVCGFAMIVWTNTQPGPWVHDFSYKVILITGLAVVVMNLNPLIKLDGYYFFTEFIGIPDLKERSTAFVSGWVQSRVLRLPVQVPIISRRRAPLFAAYALISGAYSYLLLFAVVRFSYNIASHWIDEFALIPAGALAFALFRSRLRALRDLGVRMWTENFGTGFRWRVSYVLAAGAIFALFFLPLWRDREGAFFVIEPMQSATLHAAVNGRVNEVLVHEGESVTAGQPLLRMTSATASSMGSEAAARTGKARFETFAAEIGGKSIGPASAEQNAALRSTALAREAQSALVIKAPANGVVLTPNPGGLLDQDVGSGQQLLSIGSSSGRSVRIFIPAAALDRIPENAEIALLPPGRFSVIRLNLTPIQGDAVSLPAGVVAHQEYKGLELPTYYTARMTLPASDSDLPLGTSGIARIFGVRRSLFGRVVTIFLNLVRAHVW